MKLKSFEVPAAPGKFNATEEAILAYLYAHPEEIGAKSLARILKPEEQEYWKDIEEGIKTLIAAGLAKGKRVSDSLDVWHEKLCLTTKGEAEAIKQERRPKGMTVSIELVGGSGDAAKTE